MTEEWRSVVGYEKLYEVNDQGLVHSKKTGKFLKPYQGQVYLRRGGTTETVYVFDIVAEAFGYDVSNIYPLDGNKENGKLTNIGVVSEFHTVENTDEWRYIPGYEGYYQASVKGQIRSVDRISQESSAIKFRKSCMLSLELQDDGYYHVNLSKENQIKTYLVHRLIALTFLPNPSDKPQVNHIDGNKLNNLVENLEWVTQSENMQHAKESGLWSPATCGEISRRLSGIPVRCVTTGKVYASISSAAKDCNMDFESVKESAELGRLRKGLLFEYGGDQNDN